MSKWTLIFGLLISIVLLDDISTTFFNPSRVLDYSSLFVHVGAVFVLLFVLIMMNKTTEELRKSKQKLKNIFDTLDVAIWSHDMKTNNLLITPGIEKLYGYSLKEFYRDLDLWKKVIHPDDLPIITEREMRIAQGQVITNEYRIIRPDGEVRWIRDTGIPTMDDFGHFVDFNSVLFDITDRKESEDRYRSLVEMSPDIVAVITNGKIDYINDTGCRLIGASGQEELIGLSIKQFAPESLVENMKNRDISGIKEPLRFEFQVQRFDGRGIDVEMAAMPILFGGRHAIQVVGRDITKRKEAEMTIQHMAYYDTLTGLPNRNMFFEQLNKVLNQEGSQMVAVMFLDLDRFKIINDTKGHTTGDFILQKVAILLKKAVQNDGLVSRQGGDEFTILLEDTNKVKITEVAERILASFSNPLEINGQEFFITPSIGISIYPNDGSDEETLLKNADTAMYLAKERGKNNYQFYSSNLSGNSIRNMELENGLRKALEKNQLVLHYQPQIALDNEEIVGIEALIRWEHPDLGMISPGEFIPLAEETGLIVPIGKWVLRKACKQNKVWQMEGLDPVPIAVNISARQFQDDHFVQSVIEALEEVGLDPKYLELELTESIMQNIEKSSIILKQLKELGVSVSIDDFGTGYSSLSYLKHLPIDKIKIDKSFVDDILYHSNQGIMVKTIIDMGNNLQFSVIAEGIEEEKQVVFLKENACTAGQGYFFSKPLPEEEIKEFFLNFNKGSKKYIIQGEKQRVGLE